MKYGYARVSTTDQKLANQIEITRGELENYKAQLEIIKDSFKDLDEETDDLLRQFDLNGFLDQISDNRIKEEEKKVDELQGKDKNNK